MLASRGKAAAAEAAASKRGRRRGCGRVAVRVGGRTGWAQSATHHAAAPPTPVLVARRLDATAVRDPGYLVVWQARSTRVLSMTHRGLLAYAPLPLPP